MGSKREGESVPQRIPWAALNTNATVGDTDSFVVGLRIVPDGREGTRVFARSLGLQEVDVGAAPVVCPQRGETLEFRPGRLIISLPRIYNYVQGSTRGGPFALTHTLWAWFGLCPEVEGHTIRLGMAAARRLDVSHELLKRLVSIFARLNRGALTGIAARQRVLESIGTVEAFVIALHRALRMVIQMSEAVGSKKVVPFSLELARRRLEGIRHSYEHIDERAAGRVRKRLDPTALSIFDFRPFLERGVVSYGGEEFAVFRDGEYIIAQATKHTLACVGDVTGIAKQFNQPMTFFSPS